MNRDANWKRLQEEGEPWDVLVIGGGATGLGAAVDAAARGYRTVLVEQADFAKGTSSRSTKIAHGGVRYLQQGDIGLVFEALHERGWMIQNAPHLVYPLAYVVPAYRWWELPFYGIGLKLYDALAGTTTLGRSRVLGRVKTLEKLPTVKEDGLVGGILYMDGQFDDARLALTLAMTFADLGGVPVNYCRVESLIHENGRAVGARVRDAEGGGEAEVRARVVINATGIFSDIIRRMEDSAVEPILSVSRGTHIVVDKSFLPGDHALMIPHTDDGRVLFGIPWYGHVVIGTTDIPQEEALLEPRSTGEEIRFLLGQAGKYLSRPLRREDILSVFSGLRPLVRAAGTSNTAKLSRSHRIEVSPGGLVTIAGGKWTTYRRMGRDAVQRAVKSGGLPYRRSRTRHLRLHGSQFSADRGPQSVYGSDWPEIRKLAEADTRLAGVIHAELPYIGAEVIWAAREEMARTVEDVLARRMRALFLNAQAAMEAAPLVARLLAEEWGRDGDWEQAQVAGFRVTASGYMVDRLVEN